MSWCLLAPLTAVVTSFSLAMADDTSKLADDPIAAELMKAKKDYQIAVKTANEKLMAAFADQQKKLEDNTELKVAELLKLVEEIQKEKKAFEVDPTSLPKSPRMKVAVSEYQTQIADAKKKCAAAFEKAAEGYRRKRDLATAKAVLAEKDNFFIALDVANVLPGKWQVNFVGHTKNGSAINYQATWVFDRSGGVQSVEAKASGTWVYDDKTRRVVIKWDNTEKSHESLPVPLTPSGLTGETWHGTGVKFTARKVVPK